MDSSEQTLQIFTTRIRQLILQYEELKQDNEQLRTTIAQQQLQMEELRGMLAQSQSNYTSLKMAKMIEVSDGDIDNAQKRLAKLIRDINKCITLLSEK